MPPVRTPTRRASEEFAARVASATVRVTTAPTPSFRSVSSLRALTTSAVISVQGQKMPSTARPNSVPDQAKARIRCAISLSPGKTRSRAAGVLS
jgi:hypothetical protein